MKGKINGKGGVKAAKPVPPPSHAAKKQVVSGSKGGSKSGVFSAAASTSERPGKTKNY